MAKVLKFERTKPNADELSNEQTRRCNELWKIARYNSEVMEDGSMRNAMVAVQSIAELNKIEGHYAPIKYEFVVPDNTVINFDSNLLKLIEDEQQVNA